ncbi:hypothetical protein [Saccharothrix yanglingensis]|nr:hypothetical protein [Saccharothrix yanglingensis]
MPWRSRRRRHGGRHARARPPTDPAWAAALFALILLIALVLLLLTYL